MPGQVPSCARPPCRARRWPEVRHNWGGGAAPGRGSVEARRGLWCAPEPDPGSEQSGSRPVVIVCRDAINRANNVAIVIHCTTYRPARRIYPSQVPLEPPVGALAGPAPPALW